MTQSTDTDIREIKDLIAAGNAATQKQIAIFIFTATVGGAIGWFIRTGKI